MTARIILVLLVLILSLSGCGHEHAWTPADCTNPTTCAECSETEGEALGHSFTDANCINPKTCSKCGETEGEALGHSFTDANCINPKTCSKCGETEGEALGHTLTEATFQSAPTCTVCSETIGEALTPDFVKYGINSDMEIGKVYDYITVTTGTERTIKGTVQITDYDVAVSDGDMLVERDGYKWHTVTFNAIINDYEAVYNGFHVDYTVSDYYDIKKFKDEADHSNPEMSKYTVSYNGADVDIYMRQSGNFIGDFDNDSVTCIIKISVQKPDGYDGIVVGMNNASVDARIENYLNEVYTPENFNLFRIPA